MHPDLSCAICKTPYTNDPNEYINPYFWIELDGHEICIDRSVCGACTEKYITDPSDDGGVIKVQINLHDLK